MLQSPLCQKTSAQYLIYDCLISFVFECNQLTDYFVFQSVHQIPLVTDISIVIKTYLIHKRTTYIFFGATTFAFKASKHPTFFGAITFVFNASEQPTCFVRLPETITKTNIIYLNVKALTLYYRSLLYLVSQGIIIKKEYNLL